MRHIITDIVRAIEPIDALEHRHRRETLDWIDAGHPLFRVAKPATPPTHLVSYFLLCDVSERKVLLVDHIDAGLWLPSGGHVEPEEHPRETVRREVAEELGIAASFLSDDPLFITVTDTTGVSAGHTDVSLWYALRGDSTEELRFDPGEFHTVRWFPIDALPLDRSDPHLARFVAKLSRRFA